MPKRVCFDTRRALDTALAEAVSQQLRASLEAKGLATLVVSGGSTPEGLFTLLAQTDLDWAKVTVLLADERWVDASHSDSNTALVRSVLLQDRAAAATLIDFGAGALDVDAALQATRTALSELGTFDVVILGMGEDSHTASLFPCAEALSDGLRTTDSALMLQPTTAPYRRLSLSKHRLLNTAMGVIHIVGDAKLSVFNRATRQADNDLHPISHFAHHDAFSLWFAP